MPKQCIEINQFTPVLKVRLPYVPEKHYTKYNLY